jgi:hypothetical protein
MNKLQMRQVSSTVRNVVGKDCTVFNDKLVCGGRSIKVWGWSKPQRKTIKAALKQLGFKTRTVKTSSTGWGGCKRSATRLHVIVGKRWAKQQATKEWGALLDMLYTADGAQQQLIDKIDNGKKAAKATYDIHQQIDLAIGMIEAEAERQKIALD